MGQGSSQESFYQDEEDKFQMPHKVLRLLGKGSNGVVYVAEVTDANPPINIVVKKITLSHKRKRASQQFYLLRNEIDAIAKINHQNVLKYYGWNVAAASEEHSDESEAAHFQIFMEFCPGGTLQERSRRGVRFFHIREYTRQILEGLAYLHDAGIVHGNLTCENVLLTARNSLHVKIAGFGRVKHFHEKRRGSHSHDAGFATPAHLAPGSDAESARSTPANDIWGVGCVVLEMLHEGQVNELFDTSEEILDIVKQDNATIIKWFTGGELAGSHLAYFLKNRKVIECIRFLQACLRKEATSRPNAKELVEHPFVNDNLNELEIQTEEQLLSKFRVLSKVTDWMLQAVDQTGEAVILTRKELQLCNWMDEFVAIATVLAFSNELYNVTVHPQMLKRLGCWACRDEPSGHFMEKVTIVSAWDYNGPFIPLEEAITEGVGGFRTERVKSYARQIVRILEPVWASIRNAPLNSSVTVVDLCSSYFLLNKQRDKISMLPLLFPDVIKDETYRDWYISGNIWDLGLLVLGMLQGKLIEQVAPGQSVPIIPDTVDEESREFLLCCFTCFRPHDQSKSVWTRQAGNLQWSTDTLARHTFLNA
ncbi:calcium-dependent protein kinase 4-like [Paramacrobiotus metropolitanus]|uniref:calcium-dependent protein kinase 4-like n=1 Tax=Paramacrobiotus metropolitanus TaxID=2943436 RepID=UPI002446267A|nr:calcium-dependent protein kinase 4-like [Paramacrobiotus metropolitanus]